MITHFHKFGHEERQKHLKKKTKKTSKQNKNRTAKLLVLFPASIKWQRKDQGRGKKKPCMVPADTQSRHESNLYFIRD